MRMLQGGAGTRLELRRVEKRVKIWYNNNMEKMICIATGTRAEYGLLRPLIQKMQEDSFFSLRLLVTGSHLCPEFGCTWEEILQDDPPPMDCVEIQMAGDSRVAMVKSMGVGLLSFADYFQRQRPDLLLLLGDRYEIFACATAAACMAVPIAHLYGGDTTEGAVDEFLRHSITKMSQLHFVSNAQSRRRVIQLGEDPEKVYDVGALGVENALNRKLLSRKETGESIGLTLQDEYLLMTYHPVTLEEGRAEEEMEALFAALNAFPRVQIIATKANADSEGRRINAMLEGFEKERENFHVFSSLGTLRYLSVMKYAKIVIGNSSSGLYETPALGVPCVNIGDRQKGRLQGENVINCPCQTPEIVAAIRKASTAAFRKKSAQGPNPFGDGNTSPRILTILRETLSGEGIRVEKQFYDLP